MGKYFRRGIPIISGYYKRKKVRLPRKVKKCYKILFQKTSYCSTKFKSTYTYLDKLKIFAELRGQRNTRFGVIYYTFVIKHKK